jgi:hypothetical protein
MTEYFEKVVKEIDEMLLFREIDKLIKKHEEKTIKNIQEKISIKKEENNSDLIINHNNTKEEIFELPTKKIKRTIEVSC